MRKLWLLLSFAITTAALHLLFSRPVAAQTPTPPPPVGCDTDTDWPGGCYNCAGPITACQVANNDCADGWVPGPCPGNPQGVCNPDAWYYCEQLTNTPTPGGPTPTPPGSEECLPLIQQSDPQPTVYPGFCAPWGSTCGVFNGTIFQPYEQNPLGPNYPCQDLTNQCCAPPPNYPPGACESNDGVCILEGTTACQPISTDSCGPGYICCHEDSLPEQYDQPIFCDESGNPTTDINITGEVYTAIGCIPTFPASDFLLTLLPWFVWIGGGFAMIITVFAGLMIITAAGNPQKISTGKALLVAAISGLLLIIFAAYILRLVGVSILRIPGFT